MEDSLKELCRESRNRQNMTIQDLSDKTGIPISTIGNFFAAKSKAPNVYNAGAICAALGVSLDRYFGITEVLSPEEKLHQMQHDHENELKIAHLEGSMEQMVSTIDLQRRKEKHTKFALYGLTLLCAVLMAVVAGYVAFDYTVPGAGLIHGGEAGVFAWAVIILLAVGIGILASVLIATLQYSKKNAPLPGE